MKAPRSPLKKINELTLADFSSHPIWTWANEDEDTVVPMDDDDNVIPDGDDVTLFIACEFILNDGTRIPGDLGVKQR